MRSKFERKKTKNRKESHGDLKCHTFYKIFYGFGWYILSKLLSVIKHPRIADIVSGY